MSQEFDSLASEEATLNIELSSLALRVDTWEAEEDPQQSRKTSSAQTTEINEHQRQRNEKLNQQRVEIGLIDRKLATLGAKSSGGWDSRDHDLFLRSWAQSGITFIPTASNESSTAPTDDNSPSTPSHISQIPPKQLHALRKRLTPLLPGLDPEAIDQHIEWYLEVQYLLQAKKSLLNSWKYEKKLSEEEKEISTISRGSQKSSPGKGNDDDIEKQEKRRLEIKKKLMNWQKEKEDERKNEEAEEQKKLETAKRFSEQSLLERQQTNRMKLQSWREEREKNKEVASAHSPPVKPRPKSADPEQIRRRHLQNLEKAKEKHQKVQESRDGLKARYDRQMELGKMASLSVVGEHVESKLYSSTKASDSQRMTSEELDAAEIRRQGKGAHEKRVAYGGYDLKYVGRAIPAWTRPP